MYEPRSPQKESKLGAIRQSAEKQKIYRLFKAETIVRHKAVDKLADIYSAIIQLACARNERSVRLLLLCYYLEISVSPVRTPFPPISRSPRLTEYLS